MTILDRIIKDKRKEVTLKKTLLPIAQLEQSVLFQRQPISLSQNLRESATGIIAEFKRRSPSKEVINQREHVFDVATAYQNAGASGMSVLTDGKYFGGSLDDLVLARAVSQLPLLRKDFIIDPYQIIEAKASGADAILLIAAVLEREQIKQLATLAKSLGLEVLLEVHNADELQKAVMPCLDIIGVNNRNLKTFEVGIQISKSLSALIPSDFVKISESGISAIDTITTLKHYGYQGFLIGEHFMKTKQPGKSATAFIEELKNKTS
jgi:indole-3-glycerol phosphate synthase